MLKLNNQFWQTYGMRINVYIIAIIISFGIVKYWQHHKHFEDQLAAKNFQIMLQSMSVGDVITVKTYGTDLLGFSNRTPYPRFAALLLAKVSMLENNFEEAATILHSVVQQNKKDQIWQIANLRLAKVLLLQNKLPEAKQILDKVVLQKKFSSRYEELQGDLLFANNQFKEAHKEYVHALKDLPQQVVAPWLYLKIAETALENDDNDSLNVSVKDTDAEVEIN